MKVSLLGVSPTQDLLQLVMQLLFSAGRVAHKHAAVLEILGVNFQAQGLEPSLERQTLVTLRGEAHPQQSERLSQSPTAAFKLRP